MIRGFRLLLERPASWLLVLAASFVMNGALGQSQGQGQGQGQGQDIFPSKKVVVPSAIIQAIVKDKDPNDKRELLSNQGAFTGYTVDLNGDRQMELIVIANNIYYCGSGGCETWVYQKVGNTDRLILHDFGMPYIGKKQTDGYLDIILGSQGGINSETLNTYRWQGAEYRKTDCVHFEMDERTKQVKKQVCAGR